MKLAATLANGAWLATSIPAWQRFRRGLDSPEETQRAILRRLLADNATTVYGRTHGFGRIRSYEQYRDAVPLVRYEALEPFVDRIMRGETCVLTREPVTRLLPTSGTSGGCKLIPFTSGLQRDFNRAIGPWLVDLSSNYPRMTLGLAYWSISPGMRVPERASVVPIGFDDDSAYLGGIRQRLAEATFAVSPLLRLVSDVDHSRYLTLLALLRQPELTFVSVWHPSFLTLLLDALPGWWDELLRDIETGDCRRAASECPEVRRAVRRPSQLARARDLSRIGPEDVSGIWPRWRVVSCWGDGQASLAFAALQRRLPRAVVQSKGLLATEAFVSLPFGGMHPVAIRSHFFEFIEVGCTDPRLAHELTIGRTYEVVVTTSGGLWRYRLGDLVEVDGFAGKTPSLRFVGRGSGVSDLCGEKLTEEFVTRVVQKVCVAAGFETSFVLLSPENDSEGRPRYACFIEGIPPDGLAHRLDDALRLNPHYDLCRKLRQLTAPVCCPVGPGAYRVFCQVQMSEGRRLGDIKPQCLSSRGDWRQHFDAIDY